MLPLAKRPITGAIQAILLTDDILSGVISQLTKLWPVDNDDCDEQLNREPFESHY